MEMYSWQVETFSCYEHPRLKPRSILQRHQKGRLKPTDKNQIKEKMSYVIGKSHSKKTVKGLHSRFMSTFVFI